MTPESQVWTQLAEPVPPEEIQWRQDGKAIQRQGRFFARFVAYVDAVFVAERLDRIAPGEWNLTTEVIGAPTISTDSEAQVAMKARLQILGVVREDVGQGSDYKSAATDAFKRAAVRFGIARELYRFEQNWVEVDGDGKYAKPLEDPQAAYEKWTAKRAARQAEQARAAGQGDEQRRPPSGAAPRGSATPTTTRATPSASPRSAPSDNAGNAGEPPDLMALASTTAGDVVDTRTGEVIEQPTREQRAQAAKQRIEEQAQAPLAVPGAPPPCPKCGGRMWDNRIGKRNPKAPDFKCRDRSCDGVVWPPKQHHVKDMVLRPGTPGDYQDEEYASPPLALGDDDIPF